MKRRLFILAAASLIFSTLWISDGLCQFVPNYPVVGLINLRHNPIVGNQLQFVVLLSSPDVSILQGVKKITAENTDLDLDPNLYEFPLTPNIQALACEWQGTGEFNNQQGSYRVTVERDGAPLQELVTPNPIPAGMVPYPTPRNLRVNFESGLETPTLSFDPIPDFVPAGTTKFYQIRIYDKDYTRLIYRQRYLPTPEVTFPSGRNIGAAGSRSTAEDLIPGESYIFRADVWENLSGGVNFNAASSFVSFKVPKK